MKLLLALAGPAGLGLEGARLLEEAIGRGREVADNIFEFACQYAGASHLAIVGAAVLAVDVAVGGR